MINTMSCTPSEAISAINALWPLKLSVMLWGSPGVGKSGLVAELARRREAKLRDVRLSQKTAKVGARRRARPAARSQAARREALTEDRFPTSCRVKTKTAFSFSTNCPAPTSRPASPPMA